MQQGTSGMLKTWLQQLETETGSAVKTPMPEEESKQLQTVPNPLMTRANRDESVPMGPSKKGRSARFCFADTEKTATRNTLFIADKLRNPRTCTET